MNNYYREDNEYFVYIHTVPNMMCYVGLSKNPKQRWNNGEGYKDNSRFYEDIKKYGWNNIEHEIVARTHYGWIARNIEKDLISKFKKYNKCYNLVNERKKENISIKKVPLKKVGKYDKNNNLIAIYKSAKEASNNSTLNKENYVSAENIQSCCRGKTKTSGGFIWKYLN